MMLFESNFKQTTHKQTAPSIQSLEAEVMSL